jgi:flagellar basal body-associated protein FliL
MADEENTELDLDADAGNKEEGRGSRMKLVVGLVLGLVIGGGGVYGGLVFMGGDDGATPEPVVEEEVVEEVEAAPPVDLVYLAVERMPAPLVNQNGDLLGYVFLDLALEIAPGDNQSYVSERLPRIQDAFIRAISANGLTRPGTNGQIDYDRVIGYLMDTVNNTLGEGYVVSISITRALRAPG